MTSAERKTEYALADVDDGVVRVRVIGTLGTTSTQLHRQHFQTLRLKKHNQRRIVLAKFSAKFSAFCGLVDFKRFFDLQKNRFCQT